MGESDKLVEQTLSDRYKPANEDQQFKDWACLLDLECPIQVESDWYSTKTFQVFLDALDISTTASLGRGSSATNVTSSTSGEALISAADTTSHKCPNETSHTPLDKIQVTAPQEPMTDKHETILSAEALKILSELPDLSHMSATRSFMFPNNNPTSIAKSKR